MALTTYSELQAAIANWLNRGDLTATIPDFISLTESQISRRLRVAEMEASATLTLDSDGIASLPADYLSWRQVTANTNPRTPLEPVTPEYQDEAYGDREAACPRCFTIIGDTIRVLPKTSNTIALDYYQTIPALSDAQTTNWLLTKQPGVYLYGSLMQSAPFLKNDQRLSVWGQMFENELLSLETDDQKRRFSRARMRVVSPTP